MAWNDEMVPLLRSIIDDVTSPQTYDDSRLEEVLVHAAHLIIKEISFPNTYTVTISTTSISPDPSSGTPDTAFMNLTCLKAACLLSKAQMKATSLKAIKFKDGPSSYEGGGAANAIKSWSDTICADYRRAVLDYVAGNSKSGEAIVAPYRHRTLETHIRGEVENGFNG